MDAMQLTVLVVVVIVVVALGATSLVCMSHKDNAQINQAALSTMPRLPKFVGTTSRYSESVEFGPSK